MFYISALVQVTGLCQQDGKLLFDPTMFEYFASLAPDELTLVYAVTWLYDMVTGE